MYIRWDLLCTGCNLAVMITECAFMGNVQIKMVYRLCDWSKHLWFHKFCLWGLQASFFYFMLDYSWLTILPYFLLYRKVIHTHMYMCIYTCIYSFPYRFPLWFIPGQWIHFPVLYSRPFLSSHPVCNSFYLSVNLKLPILLSLPLSNHKHVVQVCESVFCR